jgi:hypothetical protein
MLVIEQQRYNHQIWNSLRGTAYAQAVIHTRIPRLHFLSILRSASQQAVRHTTAYAQALR